MFIVHRHKTAGAPMTNPPAAARARFARFGKYSFWLWIGYQTVKGTLTTTFIWVPLIYMHFHG